MLTTVVLIWLSGTVVAWWQWGDHGRGLWPTACDLIASALWPVVFPIWAVLRLSSLRHERLYQAWRDGYAARQLEEMDAEADDAVDRWLIAAATPVLPDVEVVLPGRPVPWPAVPAELRTLARWN